MYSQIWLNTGTTAKKEKSARKESEYFHRATSAGRLEPPTPKANSHIIPQSPQAH